MTTLLHRLRQTLREVGTTYNSNDQIAPAAILWTDGERQWESLLDRLRGELPHLFTLGAFDATKRSGPAIYLKTLIAGALPDQFAPQAGIVPILYLPGVFRNDLRAVEDCPVHLQALAELQFRGTCFVQRGGGDWTVNAFLVNAEYGLNLDVAKDQATQNALLLALPRLADAPLAPLIGRRLDASDFQDLAHGDATHHLLLWINDPIGQQKTWIGNDWALFVERCKSAYGFDPGHGDALISAASLLGKAKGAWAQVWDRFAAAPRLYPNIPQAIEKSRPVKSQCIADPHWPQDNAECEDDLRSDLKALASQSAHQACARLVALEKDHGLRRSWVWATLGQAPLATALEHLTFAAARIPAGLPGNDLATVIAAYREHGWQIDAAILKAIQSVRTDADLNLISQVIHAIYPDWLERVNLTFANLFQAHPQAAVPVARAKGRCILFADGLRYDLGQTLTQVLQEAGLTVENDWSFAALPTVTATSKPAQAPIDQGGRGILPRLNSNSDPDFTPIIAGKSLTTDSFRQLLATNQVQFLTRSQTGDPTGCAWTEHGTLDHTGHAEEIKLCRRIAEEIESLRERIADLLAAGWVEVIVTTDHGWMLVPGGLPKHELPSFLTGTKWSRSAVVKPGNDLSAWTGPVVPWAWDPAVSIALAPGCSAFIAGKTYAHGGLSLQESILPRLTVRRSAVTSTLVRIRECAWRGLRAIVRVEGAPVGSIASIRVKPGDPATTISQQGAPITTDPAEVRLLVSEDEYIGQSAAIVVCDSSGTVLAKRLVTVSESTPAEENP